jgi:hypothetical protein
MAKRQSLCHSRNINESFLLVLVVVVVGVVGVSCSALTIRCCRLQPSCYYCYYYLQLMLSYHNNTMRARMEFV